MKKKAKIYPIESSPLYRLRSQSKLCKLLKISPREFKSQSAGSTNYRVFTVGGQDKCREIQEPKFHLKRTHRRLHLLISRIETPRYLFSGRKGISNIQNAQFHQEGKHFHKEDIKKYFPSCKGEFVFRFFNKKLRMAPDLAWKIKELICLNNGIPTGSPISGSIAYWAYSDAFDEINRLSTKLDATFSLWVDDMVFSSQFKFSAKLAIGVKGIIRKYGLNVKDEKRRVYSGREFKVITGTGITPENKLAIPNKYIHRLVEFQRIYPTVEVLLAPSKWKDVKSIMGVLRYCRQINPDFWSGYFLALGRIESQIRIIEQSSRLVPPK